MSVEESQRVTISFPEDEQYLLDGLNELVDKGIYNTRTEAILAAITRSYSMDNTTIMYDAAVSSLYQAEKRNRYDLAENAKEHILENFSGSRMAELLEE